MADKVPWHVEILASQLKFVEGPENTILERIEKATKCKLRVDRPRKSQVKAISYGGQTQYLDNDEDGDGNKSVKVFINGADERRLVAAEVIRGIAEREDAEILCARAEGCITFDHSIVHPDHIAWARWRLLLVCHEHGARAHIGKNTVCLSRKGGGPLEGELADRVEIAAAKVIEEAQKLVEVVVNAKDEYEPEDAASDSAVAPLVDQYGVIVRVCDQDDNAVEEFIKVRLVGPAEPTKDAATLLHARFVDGKSTASVLQTPDLVQSMPASTAGDLAGDLKELAAECGVQVHQAKTMLWFTGPDSIQVAAAKKMLQEMLQFYLPDSCLFMQDLQPVVLEMLFEDEDIGALMIKPDCVLALDEAQRTAWICGKHNSAVKKRIDHIAHTLPTEGEPPAKKRRTNALTHHSGAM